MKEETLVLVVRKVIRAPPDVLFDAWLEPEQLSAWWSPPGGLCSRVEIDAREGGRLEIENRLSNGELVVIYGEFLSLQRPKRLSFTWQTNLRSAREVVSVRFEPRGASTEVVVTHERIESEPLRNGHEVGWRSCLRGLATLFAT